MILKSIQISENQGKLSQAKHVQHQLALKRTTFTGLATILEYPLAKFRILIGFIFFRKVTFLLSTLTVLPPRSYLLPLCVPQFLSMFSLYYYFSMIVQSFLQNVLIKVWGLLNLLELWCFFCKVCWLAKGNQQPCPGKEAPSLLRRNRRKMDSWPRCWRRERCLWRSHSQWWFRPNRGTLVHWRRGSARDPSGKYWGERNSTCVRWSCNTCGWDVQDGPPKHLHPALRLPARHDHQQRAWRRRRGLFQEPGWEYHWGFSRHLLGEVKHVFRACF